LKVRSTLELAVMIIALAMLIAVLQLLNNMLPAIAQVPTIIFSTRGVFDIETGMIVSPSPMLSNATTLLGLDGQNCPGEIAIYVHGVWSNSESAEEQIERVALSIAANNYQTTVVGLSWDSDTEVSPVGWGIAKMIANENGPLLAGFISEFKGQCPQDNVRIIGHSLGSRVIFSALHSLAQDNNNTEWNINNFKIASIHLMGAAIDDEQVSTEANDCMPNRPPLPCSGNVTSSEVETFYNLINAEDNLLQFTYGQHESDFALGHLGAEDITKMPTNYVEYTVLSSIPPVWDADGNGEDDCYDAYIFQWGDNHCGYMGFRNLAGTIWDGWKDGAVEEVVLDWTS
jgi:pimeloyl-ACP methyl ester carboxylesterase